ncbi:MAG: FCD domain-containing protein [Streptosporangiales bacterium]|nr:FCD domain-containing protein [Streptosporangiales bacterium]
MSVTLQTTSTRDALVAEIRKHILGGTFAPGQPLVEISLATMFGVARPTVRSALQVLVSRHLAQPSQGRSLVVPVLTEDDVRDLFLVRKPLELAAVQRIVDERLDLDAAERQLVAFESLAADASWAERVEAHTAFHNALVGCARSPRLDRVYPPLQEEMQLCLAQLQSDYPGAQDLAAEHRTLFRRIASRDLGRAQRAMQAHLDRAVRNFAAKK